MIVLDNGDALRGIAEVASKLAYTIHGYVGTTGTQLAAGYISNTEGDLYLSGADDIKISTITVVNTDTSARTFTLYFRPTGNGTSYAISPVSLDLPQGYSFYTDGQRAVVMSTGGEVVQTYSLHAASHTDGTDDIQESSTSQKGICQLDDTPVNGEANEPITSNWAFDHAAGLDAHMDDVFRVVHAAATYMHPSPLVSDNLMTLTNTLVANKLYAVPYPIARARTPANIAIHIKSADAGNPNLRLGIYNDNGNCYPGTRLTNGGVVDVSTIGLKTVVYTTQLTKGLYWIAYVADGTPNLFKTYEYLGIIGYVNVPYGNRPAWAIADAYGNLPDPFPDAAGVGEMSSVGLEFSSND